MCILFCNQLRGWDGRAGRVGRESLFAIGAGGNLKKQQLSTPTINGPLFAFLVTMMSQASNSLITKLDSFILQRYAKL